MSLPKVTIVTITFNLITAGREEMFRQCVESVHNQDYPNIEHLIIDGASTDGSLELIQEFVDTGLVTYFSEQDYTIYEAMNKGLKKATGKYIAFLNSDDFFHDLSGIRETIRMLEEKQADFSYAPCRYLTEDGRFYGNLLPDMASFFVRMPFSHQTLFVKTDLMRQLGGFNETFKSAGDYDFVLRLCLSGAIGIEIPCNFISYRLGGFSDKNQQNSRRECLSSFEAIYTPLGYRINEDSFLNKLHIPTDLFLKIKEKVCASLKQEMQYRWDAAYETHKGYKIYPISNALVNRTMTRRETKWCLFGKIPLMRIKTDSFSAQKKWFFLNFKLLEKVIRGNVTRYFLFHLTILKIWKK